VAKIIDRLLLFLYSLTLIVVTCVLLASAFDWISLDRTIEFITDVYTDTHTAIAFISVCVVLLLISIRFFYLSIRTGQAQVPSVNVRNEWGEVRISMETVENLALKAASRSRGVKDLKARVQINPAGLEIQIRTIVDGETSIPALTEEMQSNVKGHIHEITGIPVAEVSVFIANVAHASPAFKSRVE